MKIETLTKALVRAYDFQVSEKECHEIAWNVLSFFGYDIRVISNHLTSEELSLFSELEDLNFLRSEVSIISLPHKPGRDWRIAIAGLSQLSVG